MLKCVTYNVSRRTGIEMITVECLRDNGGLYVPRNIVSLQKIQEERYGRSREIEEVSGCDNIRKYSW